MMAIFRFRSNQMSDDDEQYMMHEWVQFAIVLLITFVSVAAFAFLLGYMT